MAITIIDSPNIPSLSIQDDIWIIASSDNVTQPNFKYVFDLYDWSNVLLTRVKIYPNPSNNYGYFNASLTAKNKIKYDWFTPENGVYDGYGNSNTYLTNLFQNDNRCSASFNISIGEEYDNTTYLNLASIPFELRNYIYNPFDRFKYNIEDKFFNIPGISINWFTNRPLVKDNFTTNEKGIVTGYSDDLFIGMGRSNLGTPIGMNVWYDGLHFVDNLNCIDGYQTQLNLSPMRINENIANVGGMAGYITENTPYYFVQLEDWIFHTTSPMIKISLECNKKYETIILAFYNHNGMFDTARFNLVSRLSANIERKNYSKKDYTQGNTVTYFDSNNVYNETKINYGSKTDWTYKLTMDFPTDEEYIWLYELISSPQVYAKIEGSWFPVTIKDTNYQYIKHINDNLKAFEIEIEVNQTRYGFRR